MALFDLYVAEYITLTESVTTSPSFVGNADFLTLVDVGDFTYGGFAYVGSKDLLSLGDSFTTARKFNLGTSDSLTLSEGRQQPSYSVGVVDFLSILDTSDWEKIFRDVGDALTIVDVCNFLIVQGYSDTLTFVEDTTYTQVRNIGVSDELSFFEGPSYFLPRGWTAPSQYNLSPSGLGVRFQYGSTVIDLRNYDLGNDDTLNYTRINRRTRGGDLKIGSTQLRTETFSFAFTLMSEAQCRTLLNFMSTTIGKEISFRDHEGVWWNGRIMNPDAVKKQVGRSTYTIPVQFEGVKQ